MRVLGIVENMGSFPCPHCSETIELFPTGSTKRASEELGVDILGIIPFNPQMPRLADEGKPFVMAGLNSRAKDEFSKIVKAIEEKI